MKKIGGLQKRWLLNTAGVVFAFGHALRHHRYAGIFRLLLLQHGIRSALPRGNHNGFLC